MDTLFVVALIVVVLLILAVIIAYRHKLAFVLDFFGIKLNVQAENEPANIETKSSATPSPAGVDIEGVKSSGGGLYVGSGRTADPAGTGVRIKDADVADDIIVDSGESGDPKAGPPA